MFDGGTELQSELPSAFDVVFGAQAGLPVSIGRHSGGSSPVGGHLLSFVNLAGFARFGTPRPPKIGTKVPLRGLSGVGKLRSHKKGRGIR
ncbi:hypothetical protein B7R78_0018830 [Ralstonia solanacearum]|uniref:hypothetical protein n=1 Tax=Ralstonia solanacearum TaxID=305 RepID=UPI0011448232|nr:hypothetical protein [Ralstonia solanacearum]MBT1539073.1 hypothetical protein [Ralstonia solanacearum]